MSQTTERKVRAVLWVLALALTGGLYAANLFLGDLNQDEGWYLYAGGQTAAGRLPYLDFATTQGPLMCYGYALAQPLVRAWGVAGGRVFTVVLGLGAAAAALRLAARLAPAGRRGAAALLCLAFVGVNVYHTYFTTVVKTYALAALLLTPAFLMLPARPVRRRGLPALLAGLLVGAAAAVRTSAVAAAPAILLVLWLEAWAAPGGAPRRRWAWFGAGVCLALAGLLGPYLVLAPGNVRFALYEYHAAREAGAPFLRVLAYKAGFLSRVVQAYFVPLALTLAGALALLVREKADGAEDETGRRERLRRLAEDPVRLTAAAAWLTVAAGTALHFMAPLPYDDYQTLFFPLFAAAAAALLVRRLPSGVWLHTGLSLAVLLCAAAAGSSPMNQNWFSWGRDRIWWPLKKSFPLAELRRTGRLVRSLSGPPGSILTQDTYLAVEAGLRVPPGMELGPFCYFPSWPTEKARAMHVLNRELMLDTLRTTEARVAAFSGYGLAIASPQVSRLSPEEQALLLRALRRRYGFFRLVERFGHAGTPLKIYLLSLTEPASRQDAEKRTVQAGAIR